MSATRKTTQKFKSFQIIHDEYQKALAESNDIMDIVSNFRKRIEKPEIISQIPEKEKQSFFIFRSYIKNCYYERKATFQLTNLTNDVLTVILYIILYYNDTNTIKVDMNVNSRRKSLKRDFAKMLRKAFNSSDSSDEWGVKDRFGLRGILLNRNLSEEENIKLLLKITNLILGILTNTSEEFQKFEKWAKNNVLIDDFTKLRLKQTLSLPFQVDRFKDFVNNPKSNNYQSLHFNLMLPHYSPICPGAILDFQFRNYQMHKDAEHGSASHQGYEAETKKFTDIFEVDDFSQLHIVGFDMTEDLDGINKSKDIANRRISSNLVK